MPPARALHLGLPLPLALEGEPPRIRFIDLRATRAPSGRCRVEVELQRVDGVRVVGAADVEASALCDQRAAARATVEALAQATDTGHRFAVVGVKSVRAFDQSVVLVQVAVLAGRGPSRLVGCAVDEGLLLRTTALAVLNATNRVLQLTDERALDGAAANARAVDAVLRGDVAADRPPADDVPLPAAG